MANIMKKRSFQKRDFRIKMKPINKKVIQLKSLQNTYKSNYQCIDK